MNRAERLGGILEQLAERGSVDVEDLVDALGVSPATVRRDLQTLHEQRLLERTPRRRRRDQRPLRAAAALPRLAQP